MMYGSKYLYETRLEMSRKKLALILFQYTAHHRPFLIE